MKKYFKWLLESNRPKHILVGFIISVTLGVGAAFAAAASAEMKDWMWNGKRGGTFGWLKGNGFDWLDFTATMIGGVIELHFIAFFKAFLLSVIKVEIPGSVTVTGDFHVYLPALINSNCNFFWLTILSPL